MEGDDLDPLCIIVVKSGTEGGKLIFKVLLTKVGKSNFPMQPDVRPLRWLVNWSVYLTAKTYTVSKDFVTVILKQ